MKLQESPPFLLYHAKCDAIQSSRRQPLWPNTPKITFPKRNNFKQPQAKNLNLPVREYSNVNGDLCPLKVIARL